MTSLPSSPLQQQLLDIAHRELGIDTSRIDMSSPLSALGDSLDFVDLLSAIESEFGIDIGNDLLANIQSVGDLATAVQAALEERAAPKATRQ